MTTYDPPTPVPAPPHVTNGAAAPKKTKATSGNSDGDVNWYLFAVFGLVVGALGVGIAVGLLSGDRRDR